MVTEKYRVGIYEFMNGDKYVGEFRNGKINGRGIFL
jgi:hypothetical protein